MFDQMAYEHGADLRREAAAYRRLASRADRARPRLATRVSGGFRVAVLRRQAAVAGCEA